MDTLRGIIGSDGSTHAVATPQHAAVRDRIVARFRELGYETSVQRSNACNASQSCGPVENIIAQLPGQSAGDALMLTAHYDSVPAGPGASDDGTSVATLLEIARSVRTERFRNQIVFAALDSEEPGLLGAEGFVADPGLARNVVTVINIDNRGTAGSSVLFETSRSNLRLIRHAANALPRPAASSLFYSIYELLPNDTDMTVFKRAGMAGLNFGSVGNVVFYHTPLDSLQHADPRTVQHHGENALALTRELGNADLREPSSQNAVYFDLFSWKLVWWPYSWTLWIAALVFILIIIAAVLLIGKGAASARGITYGVLTFFASILSAGVIGFLVNTILSWHAAGLTWVAYPAPSVAAMWLIGLAASILCASMFRRISGFDDQYLGIALSWSVASIAVAFALAGAVYLLLVPALIFAVCAILRAVAGLRRETITIISIILPATILLPLGLVLYDALGSPILPGIAAVLALIATSFAPLLAVAPARRRRGVVIALIVGVALSIVVAIAHPTVTTERPRQISLTYRIDEDDHRGRWIASALAPALEGAAPFKAERNLVPWLNRSQSFCTAPAPDLALRPVDIESSTTTTPEGRIVRLHLVSPRGANRLSLAFRTDSTVLGVRVNGIAAPPPSARLTAALTPGWRRILILGASADVEITTHGDKPIEGFVSDTSYGFPPAGAKLSQARDAVPAVPSNDGDVAVTVRKLRL